MPASAWAHTMSLELGWMGPGDAKRYIQACIEAGLLRVEGDDATLTFDAKQVEIPRGFRPAPDDLPTTGAVPVAVAPDADAQPGAEHDASRDVAEPAADLFAAWLPRVASARGEAIDDTMAAVAAVQDALGGSLHAEAALLHLACQAGMDVEDAAKQALADITS